MVYSVALLSTGKVLYNMLSVHVTNISVLKDRRLCDMPYYKITCSVLTVVYFIYVLNM